MRSSIINEILPALDIAVCERIEPLQFQVVGTAPVWFEHFFPGKHKKENTFRCEGQSHFLESFLDDAEGFWKKNDSGQLRSDVWAEIDASGDEIHLKASAISMGEKKVLVVELVEAEYKEKQDIIQKSLERRLDHERLIKTQEALRESEEKYHNLVDNLLEGIWQEDSEGRAIFVNPKFIELCGYDTDDEILGKHWTDFTPAGEIETIKKETEKRAQGERSTYESALKHKNGEHIPVIISTNPLFEGGKYIGSISALTDITARRLLEEQLKSMAKNLEKEVIKQTQELLKTQQHLAQSQKLASLGQLAAGVSHELRNPLGIISTSFYYLKTNIQFDESTAQKHIRIIEEEVERATKIVDNLLEFARRSPHDVEKIDINELLNNTLVLLEKEFRSHDVIVTTNFLSVPKVKLHLDEMKQVFLNILLNASQAMPDGGELSIETQSFTKKGEDEFVRIFFHDTGVGIPEETLSDVFNPFFTTKKKGVGLGLSLSYSIVERFGGIITIESEVDKGTVVTIVLPVAKR